MANRKAAPITATLAAPCYHPLFMFNQLGDVERCALRPGNVHSADGWRAVLEPVVARYRSVKRLYFRGDAAFANPEIRICHYSIWAVASAMAAIVLRVNAPIESSTVLSDGPVPGSWNA